MANFVSNIFKKLYQVLPATPEPMPAPVVNNSIRPLTTPAASLPQNTDAIKTSVSSPTISIMNQSTVITDAQLIEAIKALQIQVDRDFAPEWGISATFEFLAKNAALPVHHWMIVVMDTSDQAGALGYHDITDAGMPLGKIFAKDDQKYGLSWSVTLSHEALEMLADPWIANCTFAQNSNTTGTLYAFEVCDAVEDDSFGYQINGVLLSSFVFPSWFEGFRKPNSTKFDFTGKVTEPFQLARGGYISTFVVGSNSQGWSQITAESTPSARLQSKGEFSRKNRRANPKTDF